jgi:hypothetical protein
MLMYQCNKLVEVSNISRRVFKEGLEAGDKA